MPDHIAVPKAHEAFNADGSPKDSEQHPGIEGLGHTLASFLMKLKG
jgi:chromate reductase